MAVAIVGGGVVGLTAAVALREAGLEATVYDRVDDVAAAQIGAGLGLAFNATRVLRRLGLLDRLREVGSPLERFEFRSWNGKLLSHWGVPEGEAQFGVTRKALHELLVDALPTEAVVCGKTCLGYEQDESAATALFEDGTSARSDVVVGADGLRSTTRAQTLGEEPPRYAGFSVVRCLVPVSGDDPLPRGVFRMLWGRGACMGMYHVAPGVVYPFGWWPSPEGEHVEHGSRKEALRERFGDWSPEVPALIEGMREEEIHQTDIYDRPPADRWGEGRVTLAGDAAHPMTFNMGQGACQGIEDALVLARCLATEHDVPVALRRYAQERIPRTTKFTEDSARVARMSLVGGAIKYRLRNVALKAVGRNIARGNKILKIDAELPRAGAALSALVLASVASAGPLFELSV
jgi:2-polyprenyl-6-methoxyphenol hydroxylase-like FAD-dependent oxidoreductase